MKKSGFKKFVLAMFIIIVLAGVGYLGYTLKDFFIKSYEVEFVCEGVTLEQTKIEVKKEKTIELPTVSREGYDLVGWFEGETLWTNETKVSQNTKLIAKWQAKKYTITFNIDGQSHTAQCDYDSMPVCPVTPEKEGTEFIEYVFTGWTPALEVVKGEATYTAGFETKERDYEIRIETNFEGGGTLSGAGEFLHNTNNSVSVDVNNGYVFLGWYQGETLLSTNTTYTISNLTEDVHLEARFEIITKNIVYHNVDGLVNNNIATYTIENQTINLSAVEKRGYTFKGFYTGANGTGTKVEQIDSSLLQNYELYAHFEIITYTISYNLNDGTVSGVNKTSYTVETDSFTILNPTKPEMIFVGWSGTGIDGTTKTITISKGSVGNREYVAVFDTIKKDVKFIVEGMELDQDAMKIEYNNPLLEPEINSADYGMSGYLIDGWYASEDCSGAKYVFGQNITEDITLYAKWNYVLGFGFYPHMSEFGTASASHKISIDSYDELVHWIEYVEFYDITEAYKVELAYKTFAGSQALKEELEHAIENSTYPTNSTVTFVTYSDYETVAIYIKTSNRAVQATQTCDPEKDFVLAQQEYALNLTYPNTRTDSFNDFNINKVNKEILVENSDQLVYAMENGLEPVCVAGSTAEIVYNKAKEILRDICSDSMTDVQKAQAIYEYLILNVNYDQYAILDPNVHENWQPYDSWYIEGALLNGKAVCDGYAKSLVLLCKMENIPAVRVTGNNHAWNKIYVDGKWFGVDATHGDTGVGNYEILNYKQFMFTDEYKESVGFTAVDFTFLECDTVYNYYESVSYTYSSQTFDLVVESQSEFNLIAQYAKSVAEKTTEKYVFEFAVAEDFTISLSDLIKNSGIGTVNYIGADSGENAQYDSFGNRVYAIILSA